MNHIIVVSALFYCSTMNGTQALAKPNVSALLAKACDTVVRDGRLTELKEVLKRRHEIEVSDTIKATMGLKKTLQWYEDNKQIAPKSIGHALELINPPTQY